MNRKYGKIISQKNVEYAPNQITVNGVVYSNPTREQYLAGGWKSVIDEKLPPKDGYYSELVRWTEQDETITAEYEYREITPVENDFNVSKLKLYVALSQANLWSALTGWMNDMNVTLSSGEPINCLEAYKEAQFLNTGDPMFKPYLALAKEHFKEYISPEDIDRILSACIDE